MELVADSQYLYYTQGVPDFVDEARLLLPVMAGHTLDRHFSDPIQQAQIDSTESTCKPA